MLKRVPVTRNGRVQDDFVPEEGFYVLKINGSETTIVISPDHVRDFCYGYLLTEGFIRGKEDVSSYLSHGNVIEVQAKDHGDMQKKWLKLIKTDCCQDVDNYWEILGDLKEWELYPMAVKPGTLNLIRKTVDEKAVTYNRASATHSAGIFDRDGNCAVFLEDIGRHNAVDKVIGHCLLRGISLEDKILFTTGRVSTALMLKVIRARIPAIVSLTAPMSNAVKLAKDFGRTLIGFLKKGKDYSIYNGKIEGKR